MARERDETIEEMLRIVEEIYSINSMLKTNINCVECEDDELAEMYMLYFDLETALRELTELIHSL